MRDAHSDGDCRDGGRFQRGGGCGLGKGDGIGGRRRRFDAGGLWVVSGRGEGLSGWSVGDV